MADKASFQTTGEDERIERVELEEHSERTKGADVPTSVGRSAELEDPRDLALTTPPLEPIERYGEVMGLSMSSHCAHASAILMPQCPDTPLMSCIPVANKFPHLEARHVGINTKGGWDAGMDQQSSSEDGSNDDTNFYVRADQEGFRCIDKGNVSSAGDDSKGAYCLTMGGRGEISSLTMVKTK